MVECNVTLLNVFCFIAGIELPDFSRPPPGFPGIPPPPPPAEILPDDLLPSLPYYDLPAGLMVPLINVSILNISCK